MKGTIKKSLRLLAVSAVLAVVSLRVDTAVAQAVDATLTLAQPAPGVSYAIDHLRNSDNPRVALLISNQERGLSTERLANARSAAYSWEIFLLGLQLPYVTVNDGDLGKGLDRDFDLLIMPSAESLSGGQRKSVLRFVERGGGVIASGALGRLDDRGRDSDDSFFSDLTGAEYVSRVPQQPYGLLHTISAGTPVGQGVPPGFRLNIAAQDNLSAARPVTALALGTPYSYSGRDDARLADLTLMVLNQREKGRVLWTRFGPQDVSRERAHQAAYQRMMVNAIAYLTGARSAAVRPWPNAARSAISVVSLPTVGFDPLAYLSGYDEFISLLASRRIPATFFVTSNEAVGFPDVISSMADNGEIAIAAESDDVLLGQPLEVQAGRLASSQSALGGTFRGLYPPGGYHDGNTLRAAVEGGFNYVLLPTTNSLVPSVVRWWEDVDYRALQVATETVDLAFLRSRRRGTQKAPRAIEPTPAIVVPLDHGTVPYPVRFREIEQAGGLFVLPFYPESERAGSNRTGQLQETLALADERGTWAATLNEVLHWWTSMNSVGIDLMDADDDIFSFDVNNRSGETLYGLTLELGLGDVGFQSLESDGLDAELIPGDFEGTYLLVINRLPTGTSHFRVNLF
jgi:polysaccharide deacetylase